MELISFDDFSKKYYNIKLSIYLTSINEIDISKQNVVYEMTHLAKNKDTKTAIVCLDENNFLNKNNNYRNRLKIDLEKKLGFLETDYLIFMPSIKKIDELLANDDLKKLCIIDFFIDNEFVSNNLVKLLNTLHVCLHIKNAMDNNNKKTILNYLNNGEIEKVNELLGYEYYFYGVVVCGKQVGRTINLPTANLDIGDVAVNLKEGVYGVKVMWNEKTYLGMMNVGHNPSFNYRYNESIEVNIFNFDKNIYGSILKVECYFYIRNEIKFASKYLFLKQIEKDKANIINRFSRKTKNIV